MSELGFGGLKDLQDEGVGGIGEIRLIVEPTFLFR